MARPEKQPEEKRHERFNLRFTAAELEYLQSQAESAGIAPHEYARRRVLGFQVSPAPRRADAAIISEINRIGVNVNQLARSQNADRTFLGDWREIADELRRVIALVARSYGS